MGSNPLSWLCASFLWLILLALLFCKKKNFPTLSCFFHLSICWDVLGAFKQVQSIHPICCCAVDGEPGKEEDACVQQLLLREGKSTHTHTRKHTHRHTDSHAHLQGPKAPPVGHHTRFQTGLQCLIHGRSRNPSRAIHKSRERSSGAAFQRFQTPKQQSYKSTNKLSLLEVTHTGDALWGMFHETEISPAFTLLYMTQEKMTRR